MTKTKRCPSPVYLRECLQWVPSDSKIYRLVIERCACTRGLAPESQDKSKCERLSALILADLLLLAHMNNVQPAKCPNYETGLCKYYHDHSENDDGATCPKNMAETANSPKTSAMVLKRPGTSASLASTTSMD